MQQPQKTKRGKKGFTRASALVEGRMRAAGETRGFAVTRLLTHWGDIVGADLAAITTPVKVTYAKGGFGATLILLTKGAHAAMVEMQLPKLRDTVNACYGYNAITRVRLTQTAPTGFHDGQAVFQNKPASAAPRDPQKKQKARDMSQGVSDPGLRAALEQFGDNILHGKKVKQ